MLRSRNDKRSYSRNNFFNGLRSQGFRGCEYKPRSWVLSEVRILVVDDYLPWHKSVASILRHSPAMRVVGTAVNGFEALTKLSELRPDIVLLDFEMPILDGIQTMAEILRLSPSTRVIFVTASDSPKFREQAFAAGAVAVVSKMHAGFRLISAIQESLEQ